MHNENNKWPRASSRKTLGTVCKEKCKRQGSKVPIKQRRGIVQLYTASVQQIGSTFRNKEEKNGRKLGQGKGPMTVLTLNKC